MRVLMVKLTSMGDVLHLLPALSDLRKRHPDVIVDWMVEESFSELPAWHPSVDRVIPVATRRWRRFAWRSFSEFWGFWRELRGQRYDMVIDAQGLMKSAVFARFAKLNRGGVRVGFSGDSIKESPAARLYQRQIEVPRQQHAVVRLRQLVAGAFDYPVSDTEPDYQACPMGWQEERARDGATLWFFHGTTWNSKHLPEQIWTALADAASDDGYKVVLPWGNEAERQRAQRIARNRAHVRVLDKLSLTELRKQLCTASGAVAVDTGLGHMAAALGVPCVSIYGSTDNTLTGARGKNQISLQSRYPCSPCLLKDCAKLNAQTEQPPCYLKHEQNGDLSPEKIWETLYELIV